MKKLSLALLILSFNFSFAQTALDFDGLNDNVTIADPGINFGSALTVEAWINTSDNHGALVSHFNSSAPFDGWSVEIGPQTANGAITFYSNNGGPIVWVENPLSIGIADGTWHHIAIVYNGTTVDFYMDGAFSNSLPAGSASASPAGNNIYIARDANPTINRPYAGRMDDVRIWNTVRSGAEISNNYDKCLTGNETGLVALYDMEDGTPSFIASDITGNGNTGVLTGMDPNTDWVAGFACTPCTITDQTVTAGATTLCPTNSGTTVTVGASNAGVSYYLRDDFDNSIIDGPIVGTGGPVVLNTGSIVSNTSYNVFAQDVGGCSLEMSTLVTITITDVTNPTASNPIAVNVECIGDVPAPDVLVVTDEADNCGVPTVAFVSDVSDGNTCPEVITRTYSVTDGSANSINVTQTITVQDLTNPTGSNPVAVNVECIGDVPAPDPLVVTDEADNCGIPTVAFVSDVSDGNTCPEVITRTYSITDACGNFINVTQTITVQDITAPSGSNPASINVECIGDVPAPDPLVVTDEADNCGAATVAFVSDVSDGLTCPETITRTYSITDVCGNSINVTQTITVNDITPPTASNPATVNVECASDVPAPDVLIIADEADNCSLSPVVAFVSDVTDGLSDPETITRTYSVTDDCGNVLNVVQLIVIDDVTDPVISNCPADISITANNTGCTAIVSWTEPTETDNCAGVSMTSTDSPGATFSLGVTTVTYTATDAEGNTAVCSFDVTVTSDLAVVTDSVWNASCLDSLNGQAFVTVTGGATPYLFDWDHDGPGDTDDVEDEDSLAAGGYNLIVTDANGCTASSIATITEPSELELQTVLVSNPSACGLSDGGIDLNTVGGTTPYQYDWDNDGTGDFDDTEDLTAIVAGVYAIQVVDANGCSDTATFAISDPGGPTVTVDSTLHNTCFADTMGAIYVNVSGGLAPYLYDWDNDGTGDNDDIEDLINLGAGTYNLTLTDDNGCVAVISQIVTEGPEIFLTATTIDEIQGADGEIDLTVTGGVSPFTYDWDNDGTGDNDDSEDLTGLVGGNYTVVVIDSNICSQTLVVGVNSQLSIDAVTLNLNVYPNPTNGMVNIEFSGAQIEFIEVRDIGGKVVYRSEIIDDNFLLLNLEGEDGIYLMTIQTEDERIVKKIIKQ